jgi:hypothetical protein
MDMETLIVKVDSKKNLSYLKDLLGKLNFVVEIDAEFPSTETFSDPNPSVAGRLGSYSDVNKIKEEEAVWEKVVKKKYGLH